MARGGSSGGGCSRSGAAGQPCLSRAPPCYRDSSLPARHSIAHALSCLLLSSCQLLTPALPDHSLKGLLQGCSHDLPQLTQSPLGGASVCKMQQVVMRWAGCQQDALEDPADLCAFPGIVQQSAWPKGDWSQPWDWQAFAQKHPHTLQGGALGNVLAHGSQWAGAQPAAHSQMALVPCPCQHHPARGCQACW